MYYQYDWEMRQKKIDELVALKLWITNQFRDASEQDRKMLRTWSNEVSEQLKALRSR